MTITDRDDEFRGTITFFYQQELGRDPDPIGLADFLEHCRQGMTGDQIQQALHDSDEGKAHRARIEAERNKPKPKMPHIEIRGSHFVDESGTRRVWNGCDAFNAYRMFLDNLPLAPQIDQSHDLGFDLWRVFMMGSKAQNRVFDLSPNENTYFDRVREFADMLNQQGIALLATIFVDAQDVMPTVREQQLHWQKMAERVRGTATLMSLGNQFPKNGWAPGNFGDPGAIVWSRGSALGDPDPYEPKPNGASFAEFHPRRDYPAMMMDTVASPVTLAVRDHINVPLIISEPIGFAEQERPGSRAVDPLLAWRLARHYSTECAGAVFHSDNGIRGQVFEPITRACAGLWQKGMRL